MLKIKNLRKKFGQNEVLKGINLTLKDNEILSILEKCGFESLGEGTLYPVLTRLDKNGFISCRKAKSPLGPIRKYYSITETGRQRYESFKENYKKVTESAEKVLFEGWE